MRGLSLGTSLAVLAAATVVGAIMAGIFLVDSPGTERDRRLDRLREEHLDRLVWAVDSFWTLEQALPTDLAQLRNDMTLHSEGCGFRRAEFPMRRVTRRPARNTVMRGARTTSSSSVRYSRWRHQKTRRDSKYHTGVNAENGTIPSDAIASPCSPSKSISGNRERFRTNVFDNPRGTSISKGQQTEGLDCRGFWSRPITQAIFPRETAGYQWLN